MGGDYTGVGETTEQEVEDNNLLTHFLANLLSFKKPGHYRSVLIKAKLWLQPKRVLLF